MDKQTLSLVDSLRKLAAGQQEKLSKQATAIKAIGDLVKYKLAYEITEVLASKDQVDPADFQDTFEQYLEKSAEELKAKAKELSVDVPYKDLDLGELDQREKSAEPVDVIESVGSPTPHSQESADAARRLIANTLNEG